MKKFTLLFALVLGFGLTGVQAQSHSDAKASCAKTCSKTAKSAKQTDSGSAEAAAKLASMDESIEKKVCEHSGKVSYSRTAVGKDGEAMVTAVSYDAPSNTFVSVSDSDKKSCCASGSGSGSASSANAGKAKTKDSASCCSKSEKKANGCAEGKSSKKSKKSSK